MTTERAERPWSRTAALIEWVAIWAGPVAFFGLFWEAMAHDARGIAVIIAAFGSGAALFCVTAWILEYRLRGSSLSRLPRPSRLRDFVVPLAAAGILLALLISNHVVSPLSGSAGIIVVVFTRIVVAPSPAPNEPPTR